MQAYGTAGSIAEEVFTLIKTVTAFGGQQKEIDRYKKNVVVARKNNIRRSLFSGAGAGSVHLFTFGSQALVFWYGISLIIEEKDMPNPTYTITNVATVSKSKLNNIKISLAIKLKLTSKSIFLDIVLLSSGIFYNWSISSLY